MTDTLRLGSPEEFGIVRQFLDACAYTGQNAANRLGTKSADPMEHYEQIDQTKRDQNPWIRDSLGALLKLFVRGWVLGQEETAEFIPTPILAAMEALGLLERRQEGWVASVLLYEWRGVYLTSDRINEPDGSTVKERSDFVFLTMQRTGTDFMHNLPASPCQSFLDLGTGNGVAGLWAARNFAKHVWSVDITDRAVHFAEFNRRLNGIENMTVLQGDLYAPVAKQQFDRIALHPPYSITVKKYVYAYGGEDGEYLMRRAVSEAPRVLAPGGLLYCWTTATDRTNAPLEQRVREMLGFVGETFDVAVTVEELHESDAYAMAEINLRNSDVGELSEWREKFSRLQVENLVYGAIFVKRHAGPGRRRCTIRRQRSLQTSPWSAEWLLAWESVAAQPTRDDLLLASKPIALPEVELQVRHQMRDGTLIPMEYAIQSTRPFATRMTCSAWMAYLFSRCDGNRTGAELLEDVEARLPAGAGKEHFLGGLAALVSGGLVEIEGFRIEESH